MADQNAIEDRIEEIVATNVRVDREAVDEETPLGPEGLDVDSLTVVEMAERVEEALGVHVPDDVLADVETVGDVTAYVRDAAE